MLKIVQPRFLLKSGTLLPAFVADFTGDFTSALGGVTFSRASSATYFDITGTRQTASSGVPRIDYHPTTHANLGFLIEEQRTNSLLNSTAPATQTTGSLTTGTYALWVEGSGSALASAGTATITGAASATQGSPNIFTVTVAGTVTVTVTGSLTAFQLEKGAFPTSLIITAGAAATRNADVAYITVGSWYDALGGTLVVASDIEGFASGVNNPSIAYFSDGTLNNRYGWRALSTAANYQFLGVDATVTQVVTSAGGAISVNVRRKAAMSFALNNTAFAVAGANVGTPDTACTIPAMTRLYLGVGGAGNDEWLNGHIATVAYYTPPKYDASLARLSA